MADQVLSSKLVGERVTVTFDFIDQLDWGEGILEVEVLITVLVGVDNNPSDLLYLSPVFVGKVVKQQIWHGLPGVIYQVKCSAFGTFGSTYVKEAKLAILPPVGDIPPLNAEYLTSRPYPIVAVEGMQSAGLAGNGYLMERVVESIDDTFTLSNVDLYGGLVAFNTPVESFDSAFFLSDVFLFGGLMSYTIPGEGIDSNALVVSAELYGNLVSYSMNESIDSSMTVVSGALT